MLDPSEMSDLPVRRYGLRLRQSIRHLYNDILLYWSVTLWADNDFHCFVIGQVSNDLMVLQTSISLRV